MATSIGTGVNGEASLSMHSALLKPGDYRILLEPQPASPANPETTVYTLRVTD